MQQWAQADILATRKQREQDRRALRLYLQINMTIWNYTHQSEGQREMKSTAAQLDNY